MTITPISPTRARLRAARERANGNPNVIERDGQLYATPELAAVYDRIQQRAEAHRAVQAQPPYTFHWVTAGEGTWTLVTRVRATGQQLPTTYTIPNAPEVVNAEVVAARMYGRFAKGVGAE